MSYFSPLNFKILIHSLFLFVLALFLSANTAQRPSIARNIFVVWGEIQAPFVESFNFLISGAMNSWNRYVNLIGVAEKARLLEMRLAEVEAHNLQMLEVESENHRLKQLLGLRVDSNKSYLPARVIAAGSSIWTRSLIISIGKAEGVAVSDTVISSSGLVGQIVAVSNSSSLVLLITDPQSGVDALVQRSRARGVVVGGEANGNLEMLYVDSREELSIGDRVLTSGLDGVFPKGILIGQIAEIGESSTSALFHKVTLLASTDFSRLEEVLVVSGQKEKSD
ncbi:MAG TPA: rod shape-determining protein MreC [Oligoflexia bacterium]|nr:rod shape-determining protein MreC [Oligoflexia bacterium]HMP26727.1 rod shape-determining protein MreC [Oligoflexia bacterium]